MNGLYTVESTSRDMIGSRLTALIRLNPKHDIFKGHFPGNPVLPGVCIIQILKELLSSHMKNTLVFNNLGSIKYLSVIKPEVHRLFSFEIELKETCGGVTSFKAHLYCESVVYCRLKGDFRFSAPG
jgi:3-hydroxyacyl-[acyl-carrier-protein] dehydratase